MSEPTGEYGGVFQDAEHFAATVGEKLLEQLQPVLAAMVEAASATITAKVLAELENLVGRLGENPPPAPPA